MNMKATHPSLLKKILLSLGILFALLIISWTIYVNNYYHADDTAKAALTASDGVTFTSSSDELIYAPDSDNNLHIGLIFYPGGKVEYTAYAPLMQQLAQRGITCILLKMPCNLAILDVNAADGVINEFNEGNAVAEETLSAANENHPDDSIPDAIANYQPIEHWYIGGHSLGGVTAAMYLGNGHADEYDGLLLLGAYSSTDLSDTDLSVLSIYGENDGVLNRDQYEQSRSNLPADTTELVIPGGCHSYFGSYGIQKGDGTPTITADEQQEITADAIANWVIQ